MSRGLDNFDGEFVYRLLRPDESPYKDIVCKDPSASLKICQHVQEGLKIPSQFISTTASFEAARDWIETSHRRRPFQYSSLKCRDTIIKISVDYIKDNHPEIANSAYDFTDEDVRSSHLRGLPLGYAIRYQEIDFEGTIPKEAIADIFVVYRGWIGTIPPVARTVNTPTRKARVPPQSPIAARVAPQSPIAARVAPQSPIAARVAPQSPIAARVAPQSPIAARVAPQSPIAARVAPQSPIAARVPRQSPIAARVPPQSPIAAPVAPQSPIASPVRSSVNSSLSAIPCSPIGSLQPTGTQYRFTIPWTPLSGTTGLTYGSSVASQLIASVNLISARTGVKRKLPSENNEPPLKYRRNEEQVHPIPT